MSKAYELGLYEKAMPGTLTWKERLEAAKAAGYDYVEISIDATEEKIARLDMDRESRLELVKTMYETGLPIRTMCVSALTKYAIGSSDEACCARGMTILEKSLQLADDLGIRVVMIPGYDVYYEESTLDTKHRFLENLRKAARLAEKTGVLIGLETMENEFMNTVEKAMKYVTLCGSNYLKVYPDIGNLTNAAVLYKSDVLEDMELGRGNLTSLHLKETVPGKFREIPYGTGHVDFEAAIEKAWDLGVRRFVTEFWYTGNPEWKKDLNDAVKMMEKNNLYDLSVENSGLYQIPYKFYQGKTVEGIVVGGNIRCFLKLAGTEYFPDVTDKILLLEARSGNPAQIVTYFAQLEQLGVFKKVKGILLGTFTQMEREQPVPAVYSLLKRYINEELPVVKTEYIGHGEDSKAIQIGKKYKF